MRSKRKKASRCAKTGCGSQRLLRCRSHPAGRGPNSSSLFPPLAAVVAVALFSRFSNLLLRSRLYALAERKVLRKRNTIGEAVNRRSPKNAFSEAASIFGLRQLLRGLKGASSPFLVGPARRNRWCFSGSLLARKRELNPNAKAILPRAQAREAAQKKESQCSTWNTGPLPHLCAAAVGMRTVYSMYPSRSSRCAVAGTPLSVIRRMAWSMVFTKMRTSFTIEMR